MCYIFIEPIELDFEHINLSTTHIHSCPHSLEKCKAQLNISSYVHGHLTNCCRHQEERFCGFVYFHR